MKHVYTQGFIRVRSRATGGAANSNSTLGVENSNAGVANSTVGVATINSTVGAAISTVGIATITRVCNFDPKH